LRDKCAISMAASPLRTLCCRPSVLRDRWPVRAFRMSARKIGWVHQCPSAPAAIRAKFPSRRNRNASSRLESRNRQRSAHHTCLSPPASSMRGAIRTLRNARNIHVLARRARALQRIHCRSQQPLGDKAVEPAHHNTETESSGAESALNLPGCNFSAIASARRSSLLSFTSSAFFTCP